MKLLLEGQVFKMGELEGFEREVQQVKSHEIIRWRDSTTGSRIEVFTRAISTSQIGSMYRN